MYYIVSIQLELRTKLIEYNAGDETAAQYSKAQEHYNAMCTGRWAKYPNVCASIKTYTANQLHWAKSAVRKVTCWTDFLKEKKCEVHGFTESWFAKAGCGT